MRRLWQRGMIALARAERAKGWAQRSRAGSALAIRFVAGATADAATERARHLLERSGLRSSLFYLGEYVDRRELVAESLAAKLAIVERLAGAGLDVHVSVDPTQIGHSVHPTLAADNAAAISSAIAKAVGNRPGVHLLMLDMEDAGVIEPTIRLHDALRARGLPVAITLQAYLRRTEGDLAALVRRGAKLRLVKGAFVAARDIAFTGQGEIKANFRRLIELMLSQEARRAGCYPIIATHDDRLHAFAIARARENGWRPGDYEFEMLLGVRPRIAEELARAGERVRLYLPFGTDWWPYALRRIGENPRNALLLARSLLGP